MEKRPWVAWLCPIAFALAPSVSYCADRNFWVPPDELLRPALILLGLTCLAMWLLTLLLRSHTRAAILLVAWIAIGTLYAPVRLAVEVASRAALAKGWITTPAPPSLAPVVALVLGLALDLICLLWMLRPGSSRKWLVTTLPLVSAVLILTSVGRLVAAERRLQDERVPLPLEAELIGGRASSDRPDIYYIILDGYARDDVLRDSFGYDNSGFLEGLRARGFYVADESRSNYPQTMTSLASSLNLVYLTPLQESLGRSSRDYRALYPLMVHSRLREYLESAGYETYAFETAVRFTSFTDAAHYSSPRALAMSQLEAELLGRTALGDLINVGAISAPRLVRLSHQRHIDCIENALTGLAELAAEPGPKFVFAHVMAPHPPFVYAEDGANVYPPRLYEDSDGPPYAQSVQSYVSGYVDQANYINRRMIGVLDSILAASLRPPVIIVQADHGPRLSLIPANTAAVDVDESVSILNAYYLPDGYDALYRSISPVNTFRIVLNAYLGATLELLPDGSYFQWNNPYDFVEIPPPQSP